MRKGSRSTPTFQLGRLTAHHGLPMDRSPSLPALLAAPSPSWKAGRRKESGWQRMSERAKSKFPELSSGHTFAQAVSPLRSPSHHCQLRSPQHFKVSSSLRQQPPQLRPLPPPGSSAPAQSPLLQGLRVMPTPPPPPSSATTSCVTLRKSFHPAGPQFPHL